MKPQVEQKVKTYQVKIYLSGSIETIKNICREYCLKGLCVTINPTLFIYTGGEEYGVEIGLINYPRFKDEEVNILNKAKELAELCRDGSFQHSYLIVDSNETIWNSTRTQ
jgi:hypothetical protein